MSSLCSSYFFFIFMYFGMGMILAIRGMCVAMNSHVFWHGGELSY